MKYLSVKNWAQFQHYKDRNPIWIKLHVSLIDDYEFGHLSEITQCHLLKLWILASKVDNKIPYDLAWITQRIGARSPVDIEELILLGYLEPYSESAARGKREDWASRYVSAQTRSDLLSRFEHRCAVCGATKHLEIDHIVPISKGGTGDPANLQVLCRSCNRKKRVALKEEKSAHLRSKTLRTCSDQRSLEKRREETETEKKLPTTSPAPVVAAPKPKKPPRWPHFSAAACDRLYTAWSKLGSPSYPVFRNAFGRLFSEVPKYTVEQLERAIVACIEDAASTGRGEFVTPSGFVDRVQYWIDKTTPLAQRDPARAYSLGVVA